MSENEVDWSVVLKNLKDECFRRPAVLKPLWEKMFDSAIMLCAGRSRRAWDKEIGARELPESDKKLEDQFQANFNEAKRRLIEKCKEFGLDPRDFQASDIYETFAR